MLSCNKAMMRRVRMIIAPIILFGVLQSTAAAAALSGEGIYLSLGESSTEWEAGDEAGTWSFDSDTTHAEVGFVMDITTGSLLMRHQRLRLGYDKFTSTINSCTGGCRLNAHGFVIGHDIRFEIARQNSTAFWIGPQMRLSRFSGSTDGAPRADVTLWGFGLGAQIGLDIALDRDVTFVIQAGYLRTWYDGKGRSSAYSVDYDSEESRPYFVISTIFGL